jgi:uracil-DNA glycosylase
VQSGLDSILKPSLVKKYRGKPVSEILAAPLEVLKFLSADQITKLQGLRVLTVGGLGALKDISALNRLKIDLTQLEKMICLLFHPQYDPGPDCAWVRLFQSAPLDYYINFAQSPFHTHFGPVFYRGRLDGTARVLIVGQDPATDEILGHRVFIGQAGQIAQNFLAKLGLTRSYLMFNTFLFGVQSSSLSSAMATDGTIMAYRNKLFDHAASANQLTAIIAFGQYAHTSVTNWPGKGSIPVVHLTHPTSPSGVAANWNSHLPTAHNVIAPDGDGNVDLTPYSTTSAMPATDVPRRDLPFGMPAWHGTGGGTHSQRVSGANFETQIIWTAP